MLLIEKKVLEISGIKKKKKLQARVQFCITSRYTCFHVLYLQIAQIPGEPKLSDYFILIVTVKQIHIKQQIENVMIAEFMEI